MAEIEWTEDVLGSPFQQLTLPLAPDEEGEVVATLVRLLPEGRSWWRTALGRDHAALDDVDVLYVHGWSDYFFQTRLARFWTARGARFHALDLRKYGRSLRDGQSPGYVSDLAIYDEDIKHALSAMGWSATDGHPNRRLVLFGHSTGGLTLSLWAARHPGIASAVVLNSPWLTLQLHAIGRAAVAPILHLSARLAPLDPGPQLDLGYYTRAQAEVADPEDPMPEINLAWRPQQTMPVRAGWLQAVAAGQTTVQSGLGIPVPIQVLLSQRSVIPTRWSEELTRADSVLVVDDIAKAALHLGPTVTLDRIDGALHDVFLSRHEARNDAYARLGRFADTLARSR
ncbi:alpha/beta hydrolase [Microbacterium gorillae]|uniref:alpha/beta hydrolase n=1 Tax=Microbacterium gorillae TaxID=1231063 RepID=UPI000A987D9B|nr:alpha/beta hydrolase [Microbacterium gorillae]